MADPCALLIDFGSTYTKLRAVDLGRGRILGSGQGPSTVDTDVTIGLRAALSDLARKLAGLPDFRHRLACSSAAGGLRMVTVGLVPELTAEAARRAALGAGAKLVGTFSYRLTNADVAEIVDLRPDILLLAGGTDGGNAEVITRNARALAQSPLACPIVAAGNRSAADEVCALLEGAGKSVRRTENVMPEYHVLNIEPAREAIRRVFIERIVHAKGIDRAAEMFDRVLMPTPAAVLQGARLFSEGLGGRNGAGPLLVVDVGGATTDVHSICEGGPAQPEVIVQGLPEPFAKRTVEGDLGMRHNVLSIVGEAGRAALAADSGLSEECVEALAAAFAADVGRLPQDGEERRLDRALARAAVRIAVGRHAGRLETVYTASGPHLIQTGKDLSGVGTLIGTGGALAHGAEPEAVLEAAFADPAEPFSLRPKRPRILLDRDYILFACGLLAEEEPEAALALARAHLHHIPLEESDGQVSVA